MASNERFYVRRWYEMKGQPPFFVRQMMGIANKENAPKDAYMKRLDGTWATTDEIVDDFTRINMKLPLIANWEDAKMELHWQKLQNALKDVEHLRAFIDVCQNQRLEKGLPLYDFKARKVETVNLPPHGE